MDRLRTGTVFANQRLTVAVAESLEVRSDKTKHTRFMTGTLRPVAVIVKEPGRTYAFDMDGQPVDIDQVNLPAGRDPA
ncbi:MAG: hypothetical protein OEW35_14430 [Gammaproteobacteria bacterium]|nr:hypothetical protein [Gammaproteobacteria bacterium]MDH4255555.1 hypothetical protein [Gammaproteobacteria bacterium]MDH5310559.1 hypothetical protein [Gammaproteobacteria bacterium]